MIRTGRLNFFSLGIICVRDWTAGNKSSFRRKKAGRAHACRLGVGRESACPQIADIQAAVRFVAKCQEATCDSITSKAHANMLGSRSRPGVGIGPEARIPV